MSKPKTPAEVLTLQRFTLAAKRCCIVMLLGILRNVFNASDEYMKQFFERFRKEVNAYNAWAESGVLKAEKDFRKVAKTYDAKIRPDPHRVIGGDKKANEIIVYTECTCLYVALRVLYASGGFNYKMLDEFTDRYIEFNQTYEAGIQTDIFEISKELEEIIGIDIMGGY